MHRGRSLNRTRHVQEIWVANTFTVNTKDLFAEELAPTLNRVGAEGVFAVGFYPPEQLGGLRAIDRSIHVIQINLVPIHYQDRCQRKTDTFLGNDGDCDPLGRPKPFLLELEVLVYGRASIWPRDLHGRRRGKRILYLWQWELGPEKRQSDLGLVLVIVFVKYVYYRGLSLGRNLASASKRTRRPRTEGCTHMHFDKLLLGVWSWS